MNQAEAYARTQADALDNIAPTTLQQQQAWQFAQSDNFLSTEEASAVLRQQLEPYRTQIEAKLSQLGYPSNHLASRPDIKRALFNGEKTEPMKVYITPDVILEGRLRIVMSDKGPEIRITPVYSQLNIPDEIEGVRLSKGEKKQLLQEGALPRPFMMAYEGNYLPTYLCIDSQTNTIDLWRIRPEMLPTKLLGVDLTKDQQLQLASGHAVRLSGLLDSQGEPFSATVSISAARKELQFTDVSRQDLSLDLDNKTRQQIALNNNGAKTDLIRNQEISTGQQVDSNHQRERLKPVSEEQSGQKLTIKQKPS